MDTLNRQTLKRLLFDYNFINNNLQQFTSGTISSAQIAEFSNADETQVRKDFAAIGLKGRPRVGFDISEVIHAVRHALGFDQNNTAIVIGAGRLGGAIAAYEGFIAQGLHIVAMFDVNPAKIGLVIGGHIVQPMEQMKAILHKHQVRMAILTVPAQAAQEITDLLIKAEINAIWNFSPAHLVAPNNIIIRDERMAEGLTELTYHLKKNNKD